LANSSFFQFKNTSYVDQNLEPRIEIEKFTAKQLKRYRTVGVKNGKKGFSVQEKTNKISQRQRPSGATKKLSMAALRAETNTHIRPLKKSAKKTNLDAISAKKKLNILKKNALRKQQILKSLAMSPDTSNQIQAADFDIKFVPPQGISEDELNSVEKIFYSFQKRTFHSYVTSFIHTFNNLKRARPLLENGINNEKHKLTGRITFDNQGNILSIKILRWSTNDDIQDLFEKTLKEIRKLPNPPHALINKSDEFTIYYQLNINE